MLRIEFSAQQRSIFLSIFLLIFSLLKYAAKRPTCIPKSKHLLGMVLGRKNVFLLNEPISINKYRTNPAWAGRFIKAYISATAGPILIKIVSIN